MGPAIRAAGGRIKAETYPTREKTVIAATSRRLKTEPRWRRGVLFLTRGWRGTHPDAFCSTTSRRRLAGPHLQRGRTRRMRMTGIGLIAAAMLAGSMGIAIAQTSTTTTSPSAASPAAGKCWDSVTKQVRNETPSTNSGSMSGTSTGSTGTGSTGTGSTGTGSTSTPSSGSTKPPEAAGLADCKH